MKFIKHTIATIAALALIAPALANNAPEIQIQNRVQNC